MHPCIVERGGVQEDAEGTAETGGCEDVEKQSVNHHADVLPIAFLLLHK